MLLIQQLVQQHLVQDKTYNGAIGVDANKNNVKTVLEQAKENGKSTGLVSTAEITDATPAAYASHVDDRDKRMKLLNNFTMIKLMASIKSMYY